MTEKGGILKVIFENDYLVEDQIIRLYEICSDHQVAFVKTSSGYGFVKQANGKYDYEGALLIIILRLCEITRYRLCRLRLQEESAHWTICFV